MPEVVDTEVPVEAVPLLAIAAEPSSSVGIWIVSPPYTWEAADKPLKAATVCVVKLFALAIDHRVSPGATVCGTAALAELANAARAATAMHRTLGSTDTCEYLLLDAVQRFRARP